jgi:hypothetical protein
VRDISESIERDRECEKGGVGFEESAAVEEDLGGKQICLTVNLGQFLREGLIGKLKCQGIVRDWQDE